MHSEKSMISIVIPAFNEEGAIKDTIKTLKSVLSNYNEDYEIIVVDDGSIDKTGLIAESEGVKVIKHPHNIGYGRSLKDGIKGARNDTIVIIDADLTYPADAIPELIKIYNEGFDMVVGERTGHHYRGSMFKGPLRKILKLLVEYTAGRKVPDANSGLRVFSKTTILSYINHLCDTFSFTTSLTLAYMMTGKFVKYIPIAYHERIGATKVNLFKDSLRTMQYIVQSIIYYNPIKIFILLCGIFILLSVAGFLMAALTKLNAPYYLGIGGLLMAINIFCLGLIADLLRQIMVKK